MIEIYKPYNSIRKKPKNLKSEDLQLFNHELKKKIRGTHILFIKNAYILNDSILTFKGFSFFDDYTCKGRKNWKTHARRMLMMLGKKHKIKKALWIVDSWSVGYFHWITDALPRLIVSLPYISGHSLILPERYQKFSYITASLDLIGIKATFYDPKICQHVDEIILPSHTSSTGNYNKEVIQKVRHFFYNQTNNAVAAPFRKIYISRDKAPKRKINNDLQVQKILKKYGFEIHYFEGYSFFTPD